MSCSSRICESKRPSQILRLKVWRLITNRFFVHERARKINIWASFVILSPYFGPLFTAFILTTQKWQWAFGIYTIMTGLCLILQIIFAEETFFNRRLPANERIPKTPGARGHIERLIGVEQWRSRSQRSTFYQAVMRPIRVIAKPTVFISTIYYLLTFAWGESSEQSLTSVHIADAS